jgi:hypothetical protein
MTVGNAATAAGTAPGIWPAWLLGGAVVVLMLAGVLILGSIRRAMAHAHDAKQDHKKFTRMICEEVWKHTDAMTNIFAQRLRIPPTDTVTLRVMVRALREDLAAPLNFIEQMRSYAPTAWPSFDLFRAFSDWGGQVRAAESQLADLQQSITYPVVREPVDKNRDAMILHQFLIEQAFFDRGIDQLRDYAFALCEAAKKQLQKHGHKHGHQHGDADEDEDGHGHCPCCRRSPDRHGGARRDPLKPIVLPPEPKPAPAEPKHAPAPTHLCMCAVPRMCQCARCACVCTCVPAPAPAPAKSA